MKLTIFAFLLQTSLVWAAPSEVILLNDSITGFEKRLQLMDKAQKSIKLETYIFDLDKAGRLILQAMEKKAKVGVEVQLLLDSSRKRGVSPRAAQIFQKHGVQVRYFNPPRTKLFQEIGRRNHRKIFLVDDAEVIVGGRNMAGRYFEIDNPRNVGLIDREISVKGPAVEEAVQAFDEFWKLSKPANIKSLADDEPNANVDEREDTQLAPRNVGNDLDDAAIEDLFHTSQEDLALRAEISRVAAPILDRAGRFEVEKITFVADGPTCKGADRLVTPALHQMLKQAQVSLTMEQWIYIPGSEKLKIFTDLEKNGLDIRFLGNSYASALDPIIVDLSAPREIRDSSPHRKFYTLTGKIPQGETAFSSTIQKWGLHTKTFVTDHKNVYVGSYNLDPRSEDLNCEDGFFIQDHPELARAVEQSFEDRLHTAKLITPEGLFEDGVPVRADRPKGFKSGLKRNLTRMFYWLF